ncbi:MAG TPA: hypothetical protein VFU31_29840 [Candidatus Binatia bacterium]|nr:hypothetical protein [Candidatus Binatia bacterium]
MDKTDPLEVTAYEMVQSAESRARLSEGRAQDAEKRAEKAEQKQSELIKELAAVGGETPRDARKTAERIISSIYDRFERANWMYDDDGYSEDPLLLKDYLIDWLTTHLTNNTGGRDG